MPNIGTYTYTMTRFSHYQYTYTDETANKPYARPSKETSSNWHCCWVLLFLFFYSLVGVYVLSLYIMGLFCYVNFNFLLDVFCIRGGGISTHSSLSPQVINTTVPVSASIEFFHPRRTQYDSIVQFFIVKETDSEWVRHHFQECFIISISAKTKTLFRKPSYELNFFINKVRINIQT
jgi:hypothetical protein